MNYIKYIVIDREVVLNLNGDKNSAGTLESDVEIDVIVYFEDNGKKKYYSI